MDKPKLIRVLIRRNDTGIVRNYVSERDQFEDGKYNDFAWRDGNFACDCNRSIFFYASEPEFDHEIACGETNFSVRIFDMETGGVVYDEWNDDE